MAHIWKLQGQQHGQSKEKQPQTEFQARAQCMEPQLIKVPTRANLLVYGESYRYCINCHSNTRSHTVKLSLSAMGSHLYIKKLPKHPNIAYYNIIGAIRNLRKHLPIQLIVKHGKGHQDTVQPIGHTPLASMNIKMDEKAKNTQGWTPGSQAIL